MSYLGADWLTRSERIEEEQPDKMLDALHIRPGQNVADIGAGVGYHAIRLSKRVGPEGRVYATDIQEEMLTLLRRNLGEVVKRSRVGANFKLTTSNANKWLEGSDSEG